MSDKNNNWNWFDIVQSPSTGTHTRQRSYAPSYNEDSLGNDHEFELVNETASLSLNPSSRMSPIPTLDHNKQINTDDDEKAHRMPAANAIATPNDISSAEDYTITSSTVHRRLEQERDDLQDETLQLRMQQHSQLESNCRVAQIQQDEMEALQQAQVELQIALESTQQELKKANEEIQRLKRENDNLHKKLNTICINRLNNGSGTTQDNSDIRRVEMPHVYYNCIHCTTSLFDSCQIIQQVIEIDVDCVGCLVQEIFSNNVTMGPKTCKTFLNGMFKVNPLYCNGCLALFGWKIVESFEEWNSFRQGKFCINIAHIQKFEAML